MASPALAQGTAVIETAIGQRSSSGLSMYLPEVVKAIGAPPARAGATLAVEIESRFGRSPGRISASAIAELSARFDRTTEDLFFSGIRVKRALETLEDIREKLLGASVSVATNPGSRTLLRKVTLALIRGYQTANRSENAERLMKDFVVSFPDAPVQASIDGRALADLYERTSRSLIARGTISVRFSGAGTLYVNERRVEGTKINVPEGEYRIFVATAEGNSRLHRLTVAEGTVELAIDLPFEVALETDEFVGFWFRDAAERERREPSYIAILAKAISVPDLFVLSTAHLDGRDHIALSLYRPTSNEAVATVMTAGVPGVVSQSQIAHVTRRLVAERTALVQSRTGGLPTVDQDKAAGLIVYSTRAPQVASSAPPRSTGSKFGSTSSSVAPSSVRPTASGRSFLRIATWTMLGVGLATAVAGAAWLSWNGIGSCGDTERLCPFVYDTNTVGGAVLGAGGGIALVASGLAIGLDQSRRRMRTGGIVAISWGAAMMIAGGLSLAVRDYPLTFHPNGIDVEKVTKSVVPGAVVMGVGGAFALIGTGLLVADRRGARAKISWLVAPTFSTTNVGTTISAIF